MVLFESLPRMPMRDRLIEWAQIAVATIFCFALVISILYFAFAHHERWQIVWWLLGEISGLTCAYHLYRWWRYPGIAQARTAGDLLFQVAGSIAFFAIGIPIIALLSHFLGLVPIKTWAVRLGLTFRFQIRQMVKVSVVAPARCYPGQFGIVRRITVVERDQLHDGVALPAGTVVYRLEFGNHGIADVPEDELV